MDLQKLFIQNMKKFRKKEGITQAQLAERVGLSHSVVRNYENKINFPSAQTIGAIACALNVEPHMLFQDDAPQVAPQATPHANLPAIFQTLAKHSRIIELMADLDDEILETFEAEMEALVEARKPQSKSKQA